MGQVDAAGMAAGSEVLETSLPLRRFESETSGEGYIALLVGDEIVQLQTQPGEEDAQWMYRRNGTNTVRFPAEFVDGSLAISDDPLLRAALPWENS
jgi:hypothetical protein